MNKKNSDVSLVSHTYQMLANPQKKQVTLQKHFPEIL